MKKPKQGDNWIIDGSKLTIYDVKKGLNGEGDNAVYQCKSENKHGYLWTNFYLNLLGDFLYYFFLFENYFSFSAKTFGNNRNC